MIRGLYTSGWSMMANSREMDVISNNLANASTNAYKKDAVVMESFPALLTKRIHDTRSSLNPSGQIGTMELGSDVGEIFTYYNQGNLVKTGNNMDLAISGDDTAFFTVTAPGDGNNAKEYYTRDGAFVLNSDNQLVTKDGYAVMGENGPITLNGAEFTVQPDGTIVQDGAAVDKLLIREFPNTAALSKIGSNMVEYTGNGALQDFKGTVEQGSLEQSNVNIVKEMVDMITVMRAYEANQKVLQAQDGTLDKAVNEVGALR